MARVTIDDCLKQCPNRFELVVAATQRAQELSSGAEPTLPRERDKNTVLALREIAEGTVEAEILIHSLKQKRSYEESREKGANDHDEGGQDSRKEGEAGVPDSNAKTPHRTHRSTSQPLWALAPVDDNDLEDGDTHDDHSTRSPHPGHLVNDEAFDVGLSDVDGLELYEAPS